MNILSKVTDEMQGVLTQSADDKAIETEFVKRKRKVTGSKFLQILIFSWLDNPNAILEELTQTGVKVGLDIWEGGGGSSSENTSSSVKLHFRLDFSCGSLSGQLKSGREHDRSHELDKLPSGSLWLRNLGYSSLKEYSKLNANGVYHLSKVKSQCDFYSLTAFVAYLVNSEHGYFLMWQMQAIDVPIIKPILGTPSIYTLLLSLLLP